MSSCPLLILMALTSFLIVPGGGVQVVNPDSVADLLLKDEVELAEAPLDKQPRNAESVAFRADIAFRRGDFAGAESLYGESLLMDAKTARAHSGLGKLALSKLKGSEALVHFKRAVELAPGDAIFRLHLSEAYGVAKNYSAQKAELLEYVTRSPAGDADRITEAKAAIEMIDRLGGKDIGVIHAPDSPEAIPFRKTLNLIFAQVKIDGKGPYNFVIDTGATQVVLSEKLAAELGLKPITTTLMHGVGGSGRVESTLFKVAELSIGDLTVTNLPAGTFNDPLVTQLADGILGTAVLSDFIIAVNYPGNRIDLSRKGFTAEGETLQARYFSNLLLVPIEVNGKFLGNFVVDTGAVATVLAHSMAAKLGVTEKSPGAKADLGIAGVGGMEGIVLSVLDVTLKTARTTEVFPRVVSIDLKQVSKMIGTEISGVLGYDFLSGYTVVLNYGTAEVLLIKK